MQSTHGRRAPAAAKRMRRAPCRARPVATPIAARVVAVAVAVAALPWSATRAQESSRASEGRTLAVWSAVARNEPLKTRLGHTHDRDLYIAGLRTEWPLVRLEDGRRRVSLDYTIDLLPAVVTTRIPSYSNVPTSCPPSSGPCLPPTLPDANTTWHTVYGAGVAPLGLALRVGVGGPVDLVLRGSGGIVYFTRRVPDPAEERLNFTADVGAGVEVRVAGRLALSASYRLDHISNGGRGPVNPSMNSRMLEVGTTLRAR